jgi:hypothetical protein
MVEFNVNTVELVKMVTVYKNSNEWNKILKSKVSNTKGYTDVTELLTTIVEVTDNKTNNNKTELRFCLVCF